MVHLDSQLEKMFTELGKEVNFAISLANSTFC